MRSGEEGWKDGAVAAQQQSWINKFRLVVETGAFCDFSVGQSERVSETSEDVRNLCSPVAKGEKSALRIGTRTLLQHGGGLC